MTEITSTKKWAAIVAVWAMLGVIYAGPIYYEVRSEGMDHAAWRVFSWGILTWLAWAPLTPAIVWLARRYSLVEDAWKRNLLIHLPAFLFISALHTAAAAPAPRAAEHPAPSQNAPPRAPPHGSPAVQHPIQIGALRMAE